MEIKKKALGKGLSALIPDSYTKIIQEQKEKIAQGEQAKSDAPIQEVAIADIQPNQDQPRRHFNDEALSELANSIKEQGILQPVIVKRKGNGFELICGERRLRASKLAGLSKVPVIIKDVADQKLLELALVENIQREDLNAIEEAQAYLRLVEERGLSQDQVADRVGKNRTTVANTIRILRLPQDVLSELAADRITNGHARALLSLPTPEHQRQVCKRIVQDKLSVRQVEDLVNRSLARKRRAKQARLLSPEIQDLEHKLERKLGTSVKIFARKNNQGRIEVQYYSLDDLDRVLNLIGIPRT